MQSYIVIIAIMVIVLAYALRMAYRDNQDYSKGWYVVDASAIMQMQCILQEQVQEFL